METWLELARIVLSFLSIVIIPLGGMIFKRINKIDSKFNEIIKSIDDLQKRSDEQDIELMINWLHFYKNEIIRFNERIKTKPEHIPTLEHYKSVFDNYTRYQELGGNGYIDAIMANIETVFSIHHGFTVKELNKKE